MTTEAKLNDIMETADRVTEMPPSQGGSATAQNLANELFCKASGHLSHIEEAEANLAIAKENAERFLGTDEAQAAQGGKYTLANLAEQERVANEVDELESQYADDCYDEGEALASAGFGTDEDYGDFDSGMGEDC